MDTRANKKQIKDAVARLYDIQTKRINTLIRWGRGRAGQGRAPWQGFLCCRGTALQGSSEKSWGHGGQRNVRRRTLAAREPHQQHKAVAAKLGMAEHSSSGSGGSGNYRGAVPKQPAAQLVSHSQVASSRQRTIGGALIS